MSIAKEGFPILIPAWSLAVLLWAWVYFSHGRMVTAFAVLATVLALFVAYFFRDPVRIIPSNPKVIVSPADGRIVEIGEAFEENYIGGKALRISIFLSPLNVHINRMPFSGTVRFKKSKRGKFLAAYNHAAADQNEQTCIGIECDGNRKIVVKQIAGALARRVVCNAKEGEFYKTGQRFGLIRFGSRTDVYLPLGTALNVKVGDRISAGTTQLGEFQ